MALLSFPEMMRWWMEKLFPIKRKAIKLIKPVAEPVLGIPMPSDSVMAEIEQIHHQLDEMREVFSNRDVTSVRIVVNPEKMVVKEVQRSFTYLNIYDFNVDAVFVNRIIPENVSDSHFAAWKDIQKRYLEMIKDSFAPLPLYYAPLFDQEVVGLDMLERMGQEIFKAEDPTAIKYNVRTQRVIKEQDGYVLVINMPFAEKKDLTLNQKGDELIIKVGAIKRNFVLPRTLQNLSVLGAKFENETLRIRFRGVTMNEEKLKSLLRFKMSLIEKVVDSLPEDVRKTFKERQAILLKAVYELSKQYVENPSAQTGGQTTELKTIEVL